MDGKMTDFHYALKVSVPDDIVPVWDKSVIEDKLMGLCDDDTGVEFELTDVNNVCCDNSQVRLALSVEPKNDDFKIDLSDTTNDRIGKLNACGLKPKDLINNPNTIEIRYNL